MPSALFDTKIHYMSHPHFDLLGKSCRCKCCEPEIVRRSNLPFYKELIYADPQRR